MKLGIFAKTFNRPTLEDTLDGVAAHDLHYIQFNLVCAGVPTLPDRVEPALCARIRNASHSRDLNIAAISGTFNMIHPDLEQRRVGFARLRVLAQAAPELGTNVITLCTGTRDPENMWAAHPENDTEGAWNDLLHSIEMALSIAEQARVTMAVEPEVANIMSSAEKARRLLDHFSSPRLKIVMDPANLFPAGQRPRMRQVIAEAFQSLGNDIILAHAKEIPSSPQDRRQNEKSDSYAVSSPSPRDEGVGRGEVPVNTARKRPQPVHGTPLTGPLPAKQEEGEHEAGGTDLLDYDFYLGELRQIGYDGPLIMHGLAEGQVEHCVQFLKRKLSKACAATGVATH
jgi:sugar phosphate isomerase/epimerase